MMWICVQALLSSTKDLWILILWSIANWIQHLRNILRLCFIAMKKNSFIITSYQLKKIVKTFQDVVHSHWKNISSNQNNSISIIVVFTKYLPKKCGSKFPVFSHYVRILLYENISSNYSFSLVKTLLSRNFCQVRKKSFPLFLHCTVRHSCTTTQVLTNL